MCTRSHTCVLAVHTHMHVTRLPLHVACLYWTVLCYGCFVVVATDAHCVLRKHSYVRIVVCVLRIVRKPYMTVLYKFAKVLLDQHYLNLYAVLRFTSANYAVDFLLLFFLLGCI